MYHCRILRNTNTTIIREMLNKFEHTSFVFTDRTEYQVINLLKALSITKMCLNLLIVVPRGP